MRERWVELEEFPDYAVSDHGYVANMKTGMPRKNSINKQGHCKVSLYNSDGQLLTRSVSVLVASAFVPRPEEHFNTPIHLDGSLQNCRADNLMWRPRWFAVKFHQQFHVEAFHFQRAKIYDLETEEIYDSVKAVCMKNGLYFQDVIRSFTEHRHVPITFQEFRLLDDVM